MSFSFYIPTPTLPVGGIDEYTKLMLHMDGVNDGTVFTDNSASNHTVVATGDAFTDTTDYKMEPSSGYIKGDTGESPNEKSFLTIPHNIDFNVGSGEWTVDFWVNFQDIPPSPYKTQMYFYKKSSGANSNREFTLKYNWNVSKLMFHYGINGALGGDGSIVVYSDITWVPVKDVWYHLVYQRNGDNIEFFVNGTKIGNSIALDPAKLTIYASTEDQTIGAGFDSLENYNRLTARLDEFRFSKGIVRYPGNFIPNSRPYDEG
jgi:hypothetical protein